MITQKLILRHSPLPDLSGLIVAGVDEAGRGALAGPVTAAAVVFTPGGEIAACRDSKQLTSAQREQLEKTIKHEAKAWTVAQVSARDIDKMNILQATLAAMRKALEKLPLKPDVVVVDGNQFPQTDLPCYALIGGDARVSVISAASILAKTARDKTMEALHQKYPIYNFKAHKGYGTAEHLRRLKSDGYCVEHRVSYRPVRQSKFKFGEYASRE